jgi:DNA ligase (NAD+)
MQPIGEGTKVIIQLRNEVLTYIQKMDDSVQPEVEPFEFIQHCPVCGEELYVNDNETFVFCDNPDCMNGKVGKIVNYLKYLDIKGFKQNTLEKIYKADLLEGIEDLYTMDYDKIKDIEGLGEKTAENLKDWLERRSEPWDYEVLAGMNISHWGKTHSKELLKHFTLEEILDLFDKNKLEDKIIEIHGFSDIMADKLIHGLETNRDLLISLKDYHLDIKSFKESLDVANETYKFCITGGLNNWSNRKALKEELEQKGHSVVSGMSSNVDYLITNNKNSSSSKAKKARNLGKPIIDEDELIELLNL